MTLNRLFFSLIATCFLLLLTSPVKAQNYVFAFGGYSFIEDFGGTIPNGGGTVQFDIEGNWTAGGGIGFYSGMFGGSRFEIEGLVSNGRINDFSAQTPPPPMLTEPIESHVGMQAAMVNIVKEFPLGCVKAYAGGGIGIAAFEVDSRLGNINFFDSDTAFAWQLIAGVERPISDCLSVFTQYRLLSVGEADLNSMGLAFTTDHTYSHSMNIGIRYCY